MTLWTFLDRAGGAVGAVRAPTQALPGPLGILSYARLRRSDADLPQRLRLLVSQLAAERSGCGWCAQRNRHLALQAGVSARDMDDVTRFATAPGFSEPERTALALADAITRCSEPNDGFSPDILLQARRHFREPEIMALVGTVTAEHFFTADRTTRGSPGPQRGPAPAPPRQ